MATREIPLVPEKGMRLQAITKQGAQMMGGKSDGWVVSMKRRNCHGEKATT